MDIITQQRLVAYLEAKRMVDEEKALITTALKEGIRVQSGPVSAKLSVSTSKRPDWKGALVERCGEQAIDEILAETEEVEVTKLLVSAKKPSIATTSRKTKKKKDPPDTGLLDRTGGIW